MVGHARPAPTHEQLLARVTFHAVTRYVQRILDVELTIDPKDMPKNPHKHARFIAVRHAAAVGLTVDAIRELIMVPAVAAASLTGMSLVYAGKFKAMINPENGAIVTICDRKPKSSRKVRAPAKGESRRRDRRLHRAERSRPSPRHATSGDTAE